MSDYFEEIFWRLFVVGAITRDQFERLLAHREHERRNEETVLSAQNRRAAQRFDALPRWRRWLALVRYGSRAEYVRQTRRQVA